MTASRLLVIDESLPDRLSTELVKRGRPAKRIRELGLKGASDPAKRGRSRCLPLGGFGRFEP